jgi:hypothetical protein
MFRVGSTAVLRKGILGVRTLGRSFAIADFGKKKSHYEVLGVKSDATEKEIKKAFMRLGILTLFSKGLSS